MDWRAYVRQQLRDITSDPAREADIVEELAQHLGSRYDECRAAGATESEALERVARELRDSAAFAQAVRRTDWIRPAAPPPPTAAGSRLAIDLSKDVSYALRLLRRSPAFTASALVTLALGIGMTTAIFSVVQAVLLRRVPFPEPERLVVMWETDRNSGTTREPASIPDFVDYRERSKQVNRIGAFASIDVNLTSERSDPLRLSALVASPELVELLGVRVIAGRSFTAEEDQPRRPRVVMISERLWDRLYARSPSAVGSTIRLSATPAEIVGVVGEGADFGLLQILSAAAYARGFADRDRRTRVDVWTPLQPDPRNAPRGGNHAFIMIGRLADGGTVSTVHDEMTAIAADLERTFPQDNAGRGAYVERLDDLIFGPTRTALTVLMAAVSLVLLISCVNVANLLIARGTARAREVAVRAALGARISRLARQFAVENVVLALGGALLGVPLAFGVLRALVAVGPATIPRLATVGLDARVLLAAVGVSALIGLVFGVLPVLEARRTDVQAALAAEGGRGAVGRRERTLLRSALVVMEVALAVVLVTGAGLLIRSFWNLTRTDPGFDVTGVLKAEFQGSPIKYPTGDSAAPHFVAYNQFTSGLLERVSRIPGVESATLAANHPLDTGFTQSFSVVGRETEAEHWPELSVRHVTPGYFRTLRVPLVRGRLFNDSDTSASQPVVLINQATADRFFQTQDPIGQQIQFWGTNWLVVGIVGNERFQGMAKAAPIGAYAPVAQTRYRLLVLMVRTTTDPAEMAPSIRTAIREIDPELAIFGLEPLRETAANSLADQRFMMLLLGLFGTLALVLAAVGVHGVLSYLVAQRTREIGVRMALGATSGLVTHLVVGQGARLVAIGLVAGLTTALALGRTLSDFLFGVTPTDPPTLIGVLVLIGLVAGIAIWLPARRAVRVDPLTALRQE
jgi:putative ABC transport system permease protein